MEDIEVESITAARQWLEKFRGGLLKDAYEPLYEVDKVVFLHICGTSVQARARGQRQSGQFNAEFLVSHHDKCNITCMWEAYLQSNKELANRAELVYPIAQGNQTELRCRSCSKRGTLYFYTNGNRFMHSRFDKHACTSAADGASSDDESVNIGANSLRSTPDNVREATCTVQADVGEVKKEFKNKGIVLHSSTDPRNPSFRCTVCSDWEYYYLRSTGDIRNNVKQHIESRNHQELSNIPKIDTFFGRVAPKAPVVHEIKTSDFVPSNLAGLCFGFWDTDDKDVLEVWRYMPPTNIEANTSGQPLFVKTNDVYSVALVADPDKIRIYRSIFRSVNCLRVISNPLELDCKTFPNFTCQHCAKALDSQQIKRLIESRKGGMQLNTPYMYEFRDRLETKARKLSDECGTLRLMQLNADRDMRRLRQMVPNINVDSSLHTIFRTVKKFKDSGGDVEKELVTKLFLGQLQNKTRELDHGNRKGSRHESEVTKFFAIFKTVAGKAACGILSNAYQISESTVDSAAKDLIKTLGTFDEGLSIDNVRRALQFYNKLIRENPGQEILPDIELKISILMEGSQDATPIMRGIDLRRIDGKIHAFGGCGWKADPVGGIHKCFSNSIPINYAEDLENLFDNITIATNMLLVVLNPVTAPPGVILKPYPVYCLPTCNCFKKEDVLIICKKLVEHVCEVVTSDRQLKFFSLATVASTDGDQRCVSIQDNYGKLGPAAHNRYALRDKLIDFGGYYTELDGLPTSRQLTAEALLTELREKRMLVSWLFQQDPIHVVKKLFNCMCSNKKERLLLGLPVSIDVIRVALGFFDGNKEVKDLMNKIISFRALQHKDAMDLRSVQKLVSFAVQEKLVTPEHQGTAMVMKLIRRVRHVYLAVNVPLEKRIEFVGYAINFIFGWYFSFDTLNETEVTRGTATANKKKKKKQTSTPNRKDNFLTQQAAKDCLISMNYFINILRLARDTGDLTVLLLALSGSQPCEDWFSLVGGWGAVKAQMRGVSFCDGLNMIRKALCYHLGEYKNNWKKHTNYSHEAMDMVNDEILEGFETARNLKETDLSSFNDEFIKQKLAIGEKEAKDDFQKLGWNANFVVDYEKIHFQAMGVEPDLSDLIETVDADTLAAAGVTVEEIEAIQLESSIFPPGLLSSSNVGHADLIARDEDEEMDDPHLAAAMEEQAQIMLDVQEIVPPELDMQTRTKGFILKSKDGSRELDGAVAVALVNTYWQGSRSKDRNPKIIASALETAKIKKDSGKNKCHQSGALSLNYMHPAEESYVGLGSYVLVAFRGEAGAEDNIRVYLGKVYSMINRPSNSKPERWRLNVPMKSIPASLYISATWLAPVVPDPRAGEDGSSIPSEYTDVTTPYFKMLPYLRQARETILEFQAIQIICSPTVSYNADTELYTVDEQGMKFAIEYLDKVKNNCIRPPKVGSKRPREGDLDDESESDASATAKLQTLNNNEYVLVRYFYDQKSSWLYCPAKVESVQQETFQAQWLGLQKTPTTAANQYAFKQLKKTESMAVSSVVCPLKPVTLPDSSSSTHKSSRHASIIYFMITQCDSERIDIIKD